ncbi:MAG: aspartate carbamoyltransferase regulatory subunit [Defluviitaleaceae bacterium]|nr:aspartate carbamoyltransferase regulatory subunit [Defluviitaleaceae bacterium]
MTIKGIANGIVIDHIRAGFGMKVLEYLGLEGRGDTVALIMNAVSDKHGRKDIIKIENYQNLPLDVIGLIDHNATVNYITNHRIVDKKQLSLPKEVENVLRCKNPRCVTSIEQVTHTFRLVSNTGMYSCMYCDDLVKAGSELNFSR